MEWEVRQQETEHTEYCGMDNFCPSWIRITSKCSPRLYKKKEKRKRKKKKTWLKYKIRIGKYLGNPTEWYFMAMYCNYKSYQSLLHVPDYLSLLFHTNASVSANPKFSCAILFSRMTLLRSWSHILVSAWYGIPKFINTCIIRNELLDLANDLKLRI